MSSLIRCPYCQRPRRIELPRAIAVPEGATYWGRVHGERCAECGYRYIVESPPPYALT
jgi:DNA-directed RNA polymerase subunit RPC12/RpoP